MWMTLVSVIGWVTFFDLGMGNGMRNKVASALAHNQLELARSYVATTYFMVLLIAVGIFAVLALGANFIDWQEALNTKAIDNQSLKHAFVLTALFSLIVFVLAVTNSVISACQKSAYLELNQLLMNVAIFLMVSLLLEYVSSNLVYVALANGAGAMGAAIIIAWYFYRTNSQLVPTKKSIDRRKIKELVSLGGKFFLIQLAYLVIFMSDNIIIAQVLGPEHVTDYSIAFKIFSAITLLNGILTANLWSAYTEAFAKGDVRWIVATLRNVMLLMVPITVATAILGFWAQDIARVWLGRELYLSDSLVFFMAVYVIVSIWCQIFSYFLNGVGEAINTQVFMSILAAVVNIPISIYFARDMQMGNAGVILGTIVTLLPFAVVGPMLTAKILNKLRNGGAQ